MLTIRLSEEEKAFFKDYAKFRNISVSELFKTSVMEKIEKDIDLSLYREAEKILKDEKSEYVPFDQAMKSIGMD